MLDAKTMLAWAVVLLVLCACDETPVEDGQPGAGGFSGPGAGTGAQPMWSTGGVVGTGGNPGAGGATAGTGTWCDVKQILDAHCGNCHGTERAFGAPMSLVSHADLMAAAPIAGRPSYQVALERVQDATRPMPPTPNPRLAPSDIATLQAWVAAGAPDADCEVQSGTGGVLGGAGGMQDGTGGTGGPDDCIDCGDYRCDEGTRMQFLAHGQASPGDTTPFEASHIGGFATGGDPNLYECFYFKAPWGPGAQATGFKPVIDNKRILHHWLIYGSDQAPADITDGGVRADCQLQNDPNRLLIAGWAPGTPGEVMPPDVGKYLPSGDRAYITVEIHYYNTEPGTPAPDRSGVELCVIDEPRPQEAVQHWLGTERINVPAGAEADASDTCTPNLETGEVSTLLSVTPHMHLAGTHASLELLRANGTTEMLHDLPFQFDNQTTYQFDPPVKVYPGDRLRTTCTYQNMTTWPIAFGEGSGEEMCYLYVTAYPAGSLHNGRNGCAGDLCVPGGTNRCIDNENILDAIGGL